MKCCNELADTLGKGVNYEMKFGKKTLKKKHAMLALATNEMKLLRIIR